MRRGMRYARMRLRVGLAGSENREVGGDGRLILVRGDVAVIECEGELLFRLRVVSVKKKKGPARRALAYSSFRKLSVVRWWAAGARG
jgi:hypothetical protein